VSDCTVATAAQRTGWSPRMLRYIESLGLVVPNRTSAGYRIYRIRELNQLRSLRDLRDRLGVRLDEVAFAVRLWTEPPLRAAVETWLAGANLGGEGSSSPAWVEWEQRKHERLLAA
jgi:MerR family transcriptional regulator, copper efflux regulator